LSATEELHRYVIDCRLDGWLTWLRDEKGAVPVEYVQVVERYTARIEEVPIQLLAYEQKFINETLAWAVAGVVEIMGHQIPVRIVLTPQKNGDFHVRIETPALDAAWGIESAEFRLVLMSEGDEEPQLLLHRVSINSPSHPDPQPATPLHPKRPPHKSKPPPASSRSPRR